MHQNEKPDWLKKLEAESWQPELVVSGIAIFASFSAIAYINEAVDLCVAIFNTRAYLPVRLLQIYLLVSVYVLILNFSIHFILRVLWIGLIGLNSVFSEGIKFAELPYSKFFIDKLKKDFPDINAFTEKIDRYASLIFAFSAVIVLLLFSICCNIIILYIFSEIILFVIHNTFLEANLFIILLGLIFVLSILSGVFNLKPLKESEKIQRFYYRYFTVFSKVVFTFTFKPVQYILLTFLSHLKPKVAIAVYIPYMMFIGLMTGVVLSMGDRPFMRIELLSQQQDKSSEQMVFPDFYENLRPTEKRISWIVLGKDVIQNNELQTVFIPRSGEDKARLKKYCEVTEDNTIDTPSWLGCFAEEFTVYINDSLYEELDFMYYRHPNKDEVGIITYLPASNFKLGKNILKTEFQPLRTDSVLNTVYIPFWVIEQGN